MVLNSKDVKRVGVFSFFDKYGEVDDYVEHLLVSLRSFFDYLLIVVNGDLSIEGRMVLRELCDEIYVNNSEENSLLAYKKGIDYIGLKELKKCDELVMFSSEIMGPVNSFEEMFIEMCAKDLDFWGITRCYNEEPERESEKKDNYIRDYLQTYFIAVRRDVINSPNFTECWDELIDENIECVSNENRDVCFTRFFATKGFKYDTYVYTEDLRNENRNPLVYLTEELVSNRRCPVFMRKMFAYDYMDMITCSKGGTSSSFFEYLKNSKKYDVEMIWQNILRTEHQEDFVRALNLNYILPSNSFNVETLGSKCSMVIHLYYADMADEMLKYASFMPNNADIYFTVVSQNVSDVLKSKLLQFPEMSKRTYIRLIENRGRDVGSILVGVKDVINKYDLVCFIHDKKTPHLKPGTVGRGFAETCYGNICFSKEYVFNVINLFEKNSRMGLAVPPMPSHGMFFGGIGDEWGPNYKCSLELSEKLGIKVPIDDTKKPVAPYGTCFWFRPKAFSVLYDKDWNYTDFPEEPNKNDGTILHAVERLYSFATQEAGYYPALIMSDYYAGIEYSNLEFYVRKYNDAFLDKRYRREFYKTIETVPKADASYIVEYMDANDLYDRLREDQRLIVFKKIMARKVPKRVWNVCIRILGGKNKWLKDILKL